MFTVLVRIYKQSAIAPREAMNDISVINIAISNNAAYLILNINKMLIVIEYHIRKIA